MCIFRELKQGIALVDDKYNSLDAASKKAAYQGIGAVCASRIAMATPGMGTFSFTLNEKLTFVMSKT